MTIFGVGMFRIDIYRSRMAPKPTFLESGGAAGLPYGPPARPLRYRYSLSQSQRRRHAHAPCKLVAPMNFRYVRFLYSHFPPKYRFFGKYFKNGRHCFKSMAYLYSTRSGDRARCHQIEIRFFEFPCPDKWPKCRPRGQICTKSANWTRRPDPNPFVGTKINKGASTRTYYVGKKRNSTKGSGGVENGPHEVRQT